MWHRNEIAKRSERLKMKTKYEITNVTTVFFSFCKGLTCACAVHFSCFLDDKSSMTEYSTWSVCAFCYVRRFFYFFYFIYFSNLLLFFSLLIFLPFCFHTLFCAYFYDRLKYTHSGQLCTQTFPLHISRWNTL